MKSELLSARRFLKIDSLISQRVLICTVANFGNVLAEYSLRASPNLPRYRSLVNFRSVEVRLTVANEVRIQSCSHRKKIHISVGAGI